MSGERRTKLFWNLHLKPKTVSELKVALEKIWDNFPQVQLIKLSRTLQLNGSVKEPNKFHNYETESS